MLTKNEKLKLVGNLKDLLSRARLVVLTDFSGLKTTELSDLRSRLRESQAAYIVAKKKLIALAGLSTDYAGPVALALTQNNEFSLAKILYNFSRENKCLRVIEGVLEGKKIDLTKFQELAKLPTRDELLRLLWQRLKTPTHKLILIIKQYGQGKGD